jgi:diguanylate cyclase (GGDEF)-like protein/PAS domain S-box-containing protein
MNDSILEIREFHWLVDMLETIEVGLVVLDRQYRVHAWNGFMENHSGLTGTRVRERNLFELFPDLPTQWLKRKIDTVLQLNTRTFSSWEQRPYLFRFPNCRPITGTESFMYQNVTICPLASADGSRGHVCILIYDATETAASRRGLERANAQLEKLSQTDRLTGLLNRGAWENLLIGEFERYRRYQHECAVVMFDIDHFKPVNDTYGHQVGDDVIRHTSQTLRNNLRQTDLGGRYGGEEFGVILPETDERGAGVFCERVREQIANAVVETHGEKIRYTISLGVALLDRSMPDYLHWLEAADKALYEAKENGRNQVRFFA